MTVESLLEELNEYGNVLQIWDEFSTLIEQFGLYKSGGGAFDRSIFLTLYNGEPEMSHATKKYKVKITQPRLSIMAAGHPHKLIEMLNKERKMSNGCDGLISRFIIAAPKAVRISIIDLKQPPSNSFQLKHLLYGIYALNKNFKIKNNNADEKVLLKLSEIAFEKVNEKFDEYDIIACKFELSKSFIR